MSRLSIFPREEVPKWTILQPFWSPKTIEKWQQQVFGPKGTEVPQNLLYLSSTVHDLWGMARLALDPVEVSNDKKSLTIRFWWLPRNKATEMVPIQNTPVLPPNPKMSALKCKLWDCQTEKRLDSGHLITMKTNDPLSMPLPSFELLHMQWVLNRVAALCGAANVTDEELEDRFGGMGPSAIFSVESDQHPPSQLPMSPRRQSNTSENQPLVFRTRERSKVRELSEKPCDDPSSQL